MLELFGTICYQEMTLLNFLSGSEPAESSCYIGQLEPLVTLPGRAGASYYLGLLESIVTLTCWSLLLPGPGPAGSCSVIWALSLDLSLLDTLVTWA